MNLRKLLLTKNNCYTAGAKLSPKGIMVHSTGANNPNLKRYVGPDDGLLGVNSAKNHWNQPKPDGRDVCVHAFIGKLDNGDVATYQTLPWDMRGWHAGGKANDTHIGFEICEDSLKDFAYFKKVYEEAVSLCALLCKSYGIKPEKPFLICHSEGAELGIASNHGDVMHWFPKHGKNMDIFRQEVADTIAGMPDKTPEEIDAIKKTVAILQQAKTDGILTDTEHWLGVLSGTIAPNRHFIKIILDNIYKKLNGIDNLSALSAESTVDNTLAAGVITDKVYWLGVLDGSIAANKEYIQIVFNNAHEIIKTTPPKAPAADEEAPDFDENADEDFDFEEEPVFDEYPDFDIDDDGDIEPPKLNWFKRLIKRIASIFTSREE